MDLTIGPDGNLFYVDFDGGRILRGQYGLAAVATASADPGDAPLTVDFDGTGSIPAQPGDTLTYAWDLDGDGQFDDSTDPTPRFTYATAGTYTVRLRVTDQRGGIGDQRSDHDQGRQHAPTAFVDTPPRRCSGRSATRSRSPDTRPTPRTATLPPSALSWQVIIHHCPSNCHTHVYQTFDGVAGGSFPAPDHEYPAYLEIALTATDTRGADQDGERQHQPADRGAHLPDRPAGSQLTVGTPPPQPTPFTQTVIVNSVNAVQAPAPGRAAEHLGVLVLVRRRRAEPQHHGAGGSSTYTATYRTHADLSIAVGAGDGLRGTGAHVHAQRRQRRAVDAVSVAVTDMLPAGRALDSAGGTAGPAPGRRP